MQDWASFDEHLQRKQVAFVLDAVPCAVAMGVRELHELLTMHLLDAAGEIIIADDDLESCPLLDAGLDLGVSNVRQQVCVGGGGGKGGFHMSSLARLHRATLCCGATN